MSGKRKNAGEGYGYMFSGAFSAKKDAVAKEKTRKGSFIRGVPTAHGWRYLVMTPRTNPRRHPSEKKISLKEFRKLLREHGYGPGAAIRGATRAQAEEMIRLLDQRHAKYAGQNPMDLVVMGANPNPHDKEITVKPGETITLRINPSPLAPQENSLGTFLGWAPSLPASKRERAGRRRAWQSAIRTESKRSRAELQGWHRSARKSFKGKKKLQDIFHEVYGSNPAICGVMIGGYPCTRKPGHRGPHLPQGATLRPRSRHNWGQRGNPSAESIREEFTGMPVGRLAIYDEPHMPKGDYALLGKFLGLYVKPHTGGQVIQIKGAGVQVVCDETARQIWFVGGDQDISESLASFGAIDRGAGIFDLGKARRIDYKQRKEHVPKPEFDEWKHFLGEETGELPTVLFDANHKRLLLEGGAYRVRPEGILN